ncbi:helix-turn-helix transcriptional regulator [Pseudomonas sp. NPDC090202]|uniref:helix-turn-helix transcriptional regulator n=1 Tax=unclassified Pseudomonas TaxID=196821 RepID=UPI003818CDB5
MITRLGKERSLRTTQRDLKTLEEAGAAGCDKEDDKVFWFRKQIATSLGRMGQLKADEAINLVLLLEHGARFGMSEQVKSLDVIKNYAQGVLLEATAQHDWSSSRLTSSTRFVALQPAEFDPQLLKTVQGALLEERALKIAYCVPERGDLSVEYVLTVLGLSFQDANIYVSCLIQEERWPQGHEPAPGAARYKYESNGVRTLSVLQMHRVQSASVARADAEVPDGYDINAPQIRKDLLSLYSSEPMALRLRVKANLRKRLSENRLADDQVIEQEGPDSWLLQCHVHDGQGLRLWLLSNADQIEVVAPAALRQYMRDTLAAALTAYE